MRFHEILKANGHGGGDVSDGPRRTVQIVIYGRARKIPRVHWSFAHVTSSGGSGARRRSEEPELPLTTP